MNALSTVLTVNSLLDEAKQSILPYEVVIEAINRAQREMVHLLHRTNDERGLRPLVVLTAQLETDEIIDDVLFVRGALWYPSGVATLFQGLYAHYVEYDLYLNHESQSVTMVSPHWYTCYSFVTDMLKFPTRTGDERVRLCYIRKPVDFVCEHDGITISNQEPLELPEEYHFMVCQKAAKLLNDLDVEEQGREGIENL